MSASPRAGSEKLALAGAGAALVLLALRAGSSRHPRHETPRRSSRSVRASAVRPEIKAARNLNRAAGILALAVLADSGLEHYRGSFFNPAMYTPIAVSSLAVAASLHGAADSVPRSHRLRDGIYGLSAITGVVGTGFHLYNVLSRPGGMSWLNLFYGAPLGAPSAITLAGLLGFMAERLRDGRRGRPARIFGLPAGKLTAAITSLGLLGTSAEAGMLHFRGAFHDPFMFLPVTIPPAGAVLMARAAFGEGGRRRSFTRAWMKLVAAVGLAGAAFHAYGIHRNMGGWRNWSQNILNGPPLPAPPSFTGLAFAGLAALALREERPHE